MGSSSKKRAHHLSLPPQDENVIPVEKNQDKLFYYVTPSPDTVIVQKQPIRSKDACCWGCLAAICLCFGAKECC